MASYVYSLFFLSLITLSLQIDAWESKVSRYINEDSISLSPLASPTPAPAPAPEAAEEVVVEHGYGLYGPEENYHYPPTTTRTTTTATASEEKYPTNYDEFEKAQSDENTKLKYNEYAENNGKVGKQGLSDTRFLENGKYYYHVQNPNGYLNKQNENSYENNVYVKGEYKNNNDRYGNAYNENREYGVERQGMSDTRFLENGKYFYNARNERKSHTNGYVNEGREGYNNEYKPMEEFGNEDDVEEPYTEGQNGYFP